MHILVIILNFFISKIMNLHVAVWSLTTQWQLKNINRNNIVCVNFKFQVSNHRQTDFLLIEEKKFPCACLCATISLRNLNVRKNCACLSSGYLEESIVFGEFSLYLSLSFSLISVYIYLYVIELMITSCSLCQKKL